MRGKIHLNLTERKTIRGIYIRICGTAKVHWSEGTDDDRKSYSGNEDYLYNKTFLVGGDSGTVQNIQIVFLIEHFFAIEIDDFISKSINSQVKFDCYRAPTITLFDICCQ